MAWVSSMVFVRRTRAAPEKERSRLRAAMRKLYVHYQGTPLQVNATSRSSVQSRHVGGIFAIVVHDEMYIVIRFRAGIAVRQRMRWLDVPIGGVAYLAPGMTLEMLRSMKEDFIGFQQQRRREQRAAARQR